MSEPPKDCDVSKDALLQIFQQRMDKCTNEQFWAVATLSAFYAGLLSNPSLSAGLAKWLIAIVLSAASFYGVFFVVNRHKAYYDYRKDFADLLKDCTFAPRVLKEARSAWDLSRFSGLFFYSSWILVGYAVTMYVLLRKCD